MRKTNPNLTQHTRNLAASTQEYHYVVKDWKTGTEHPFETEQEASKASYEWAMQNKTAYRYTTYKVPGGF